MTSTKDNVGKFIISGKLGIGEIVEVAKMGEDGDFYKVDFKKSAAINYYSTHKQINYRILESRENLEKAISIFKDVQELREFPSAQEKVQYYKKNLKSCKVSMLANHLSSLRGEGDIHPSLKKDFNEALQSFVQEIEFIFNIKNIEAWRLLGLNKDNK